MGMPEAAVDQYSGRVFRQHKVWTTRQFRSVQAKPEPSRVEATPDEKFRLRVLSSNA